MEQLMWCLEMLGTVAFSISGAMEAIKKEMDLLGVVILGLVTAMGGGVLRDIVIGHFPPRAFQSAQYAMVAVITAVITFVVVAVRVKHPLKVSLESWNRMLFLSDSIGLSAFTVMGVSTAQQSISAGGLGLLLFVGVITGVGGGVMRDVFAGNVPYILRKHVYATASIVGVLVYLAAQRFMLQEAAAVIGMLSVFVVRLLARHFEWSLPKIKMQH